MTLSLLLLLACGGTAPAPGPAHEEAPAPAPEAPGAPAPQETASRLEIPADGGPIVVTPVMHATTVIEHGGAVIWVDPWSKAPLEGRPAADVVLITDIHPDHLDPAALTAVSDDDTLYVAPPAAVDALLEAWGDGAPASGRVQRLANGESTRVGSVDLTAVPMYNVVRGPEAGKLFHDKGRGNGYLVKLGGKVLYFGGDTECTDEMKALTGVDVAFVPMNLPYTMTPDEAAVCVKAFQPKLAVPYHYRGQDRKVFADALASTSGVEVRLLEYYPGGEDAK